MCIRDRLGVFGAVVFANDNDKFAVQTYQANHTKVMWPDDIAKIDGSAIPDHDLLTAGFPCQSFSIAGKRSGFDDKRGDLFWHIIRVLDAKKPKWVLLENVPGLVSIDNGRTFDSIARALTNLGYGFDYKILNATNYDVP